MRSSILVKIGGKILEDSTNLERTLTQFRQLLFTDKILDKILILPGGGTYANFVRMIDRKLNIGNTLAHWMAIYAMDENAKELYEKHKHDILLIKTFTQCKQVFEDPKEKGIYVFSPFTYLYESDPLPHSWEVTSDSIAVFLSHSLNLKVCFLIKDVDGIYDKNNQIIKKITANDLLRLMENDGLRKLTSKKKEGEKISRPVDPYVFTLINKYKTSCTILNGVSENYSILEYFKTPNEKFKRYTKIFPS